MVIFPKRRVFSRRHHEERGWCAGVASNEAIEHPTFAHQFRQFRISSTDVVLDVLYVGLCLCAIFTVEQLAAALFPAPVQNWAAAVIEVFHNGAMALSVAAIFVRRLRVLWR